MSNAPLRRSPGTRFSLLHLLILTTLIAVGIAVGLAYRRNRQLMQQRDELLSLSSPMPIHNDDELVSVAMTAVADDFESWLVHVPSGRDYELRLGIGTISEKGIPPLVGSVAIPAGEHRVTLYADDSATSEYRYVVYLDGNQVIEKTMGGQWMPHGWSSASGAGWPFYSELAFPALQLAAKNYAAKHDFGPQHYFQANSDRYVTGLGFRLWIDQPDRTYPAASPFLGFRGDPRYNGTGLRDGVRLGISNVPYQWAFTRPSLATTDSVLQIEARFVAADGTILSTNNQVFESWEIRNAATGSDPLLWQEEPEQTSQTIFLHNISRVANALQPVIEMKWDISQPDAVAIRLAATAVNDRIGSWRLRFLDGTQHLWRELQIGDRTNITPVDALNAGNVRDTKSAKPSKRTVDMSLGDGTASTIQLQLQPRESLPLQIEYGNDTRYDGINLYQGLPMKFGIEVPASLKPKLAVEIVDQHPQAAGTAMPGGPFFDTIDIELDAKEREWIWLRVKSKE